MSKLDRPTHLRVGVTASPPLLGDRMMRRLLILTAALGLFATVIAPLTRAASSAASSLVQCGGPVRSAPDDPIVGGVSHNHEFYGNRSIGLGSTYGSLTASRDQLPRPARQSELLAPDALCRRQPRRAPEVHRVLHGPRQVARLDDVVARGAQDHRGRQSRHRASAHTHRLLGLRQRLVGLQGRLRAAVQERRHRPHRARALPRLLGRRAPGLRRPQVPHGLLGLGPVPLHPPRVAADPHHSLAVDEPDPGAG